MNKNVGPIDRMIRAVVALTALIAGLVAPVPMAARVGLGGSGVYLLLTALAGTCLGYRLMGLSTCPTARR
jgi:hypothetical protein